MAGRSSKPPSRGSVPPSLAAGKKSSNSVLPRFYRTDSLEPAELTETFVAPDSKRSLPEIPTITVLSGADTEQVFPLVAETTWIGREEGCTIRLSDRGISRRHASITINRTEAIVRDNDARNGTYVNGRRVSAHRLRPGDEIQIGPYVSLLFSTGTGQEQRLAQQQATREELLTEQMYHERIESLAHLVTSLAHQLNTPLGVATTAHGLISTLMKEMADVEPGPHFTALLGELKHSTDLIGRNLVRANHLVQGFKQLSARQLSDDYMDCDLGSLVDDCFAAMAVEMQRRKLVVKTKWTTGAEFPWSGFPGHLTQVLITLTRNTLVHAYRDGEPGRIDVSIVDERNMYRIEFRDHGAGIPSEIFRRLFEPFVTTARELGAMGLGLAVAHNIVTNILGGQITCSSVVGKGTTVLMRIPRVCPRDEESTGPGTLTPARPAG